MANRGDVIGVDRLWGVFDVEREKAWDGVDAPVGSPEWNIAAGKIDVINNICNAVHNMNAEPRSSADQAEKPVWKETSSVVHTDYADGSAETKTVKHAAWRCPVCGWFVGEQVDVYCEFSLIDALALIEEFSAADVAPVRHGRWIWNSHHCKWECSECGGMEGECESPVCKWCGARMDKEEKRVHEPRAD